jgi:hypothetical protein
MRGVGSGAALAASLLAVLWGAHPARAASCAATERPVVTVELGTPRIQRDDTLSLAELRRRFEGGSGVAGSAHRIVYGLTESTRNVRISVATGVRPLGRDGYCAWLRRVRVVIVPEMHVHVAREAAENACFFGYVLDHEMHHVAVEERFAAGEPLYLESRVREVAEQIPARVFAASQSQSSWLDQLTRVVLDEVKAAGEALVPERRARHRHEVDEPQRNSATQVCDGFARALIDRQLAELGAGR